MQPLHISNKLKSEKEKFAENAYRKYLKAIEDQFGSNITDNYLLDSICSLIIPNFKGVFSSDKVPALKNNQSCIINLDPSTRGGSHWTALYKEKNNYLFYDSFARSHTKILKSISKLNPINSDLRDREQKINQDNCGQRCIAWLQVTNIHGADYSKLV
jgi:hypothetical protein